MGFHPELFQHLKDQSGGGRLWAKLLMQGPVAVLQTQGHAVGRTAQSSQTAFAVRVQVGRGRGLPEVPTVEESTTEVHSGLPASARMAAEHSSPVSCWRCSDAAAFVLAVCSTAPAGVISSAHVLAVCSAAPAGVAMGALRDVRRGQPRPRWRV
ncbi:hypothetical protein [Arthrobacter sp. A5]|uniref:hypothetical protein n=1 Tax=Arthrobacter sp. A5 TaxID=576926 RepID=UPI003DA8A1A6